MFYELKRFIILKAAKDKWKYDLFILAVGAVGDTGECGQAGRHVATSAHNLIAP